MDVAAIEHLLDGLWGLCLSGGPDLHPSGYGAEPHRELGPTEPQLDTFEIAPLRAAEAREMPVLAICRGLQALNVARGGTLIQDLPTQRPSEIDHRQAQAGSTPTHGVALDDSLTAQCRGVRDARVNSFHHRRSMRWGPDCERSAGRPTAWWRRSRRPTAGSRARCSGTRRA